MPRRSAATDLVRRKAGETPKATPEHLAHLLEAMDGPIDPSEAPEVTGPLRRVRRDEAGRLVRSPLSPIRRAILGELGRRGMTRYQLWKAARVFCPTLNASAVYEYLRGQRDIGVSYVEALMRAVGVRVTGRKTRAAAPKAGATAKGARKAPTKAAEVAAPKRGAPRRAKIAAGGE
jgi:hypothetical protein